MGRRFVFGEGEMVAEGTVLRDVAQHGALVMFAWEHDFVGLQLGFEIDAEFGVENHRLPPFSAIDSLEARNSRRSLERGELLWIISWRMSFNRRGSLELVEPALVLQFNPFFILIKGIKMPSGTAR